MNAILQNNLKQIEAACKTHNVKSLFAFGSVCSDKFTELSDIDLLVSFHPMDYGEYADNYFDMAEKMEEVFQRSVDLVTENSLSNPYFIKSVNESKIQLYG